MFAVHIPGLKQRENITATIGRGFFHLEGEWPSLSQDLWLAKILSILGYELQGKKGPKRMAGQAVWLCYVSVGFSHSLATF